MTQHPRFKFRLQKATVAIFIIFLLLGLSHNTIAQKRESRVIEDGGSGPYSAIMEMDPTLPTHTIFRPQDKA